MKTKILGGLTAVLLLATLVQGCSTLFKKDYTIEVENFAGLPVDIYYRATGDATWTKTKTVLSDYTAYVDLPAGTYDFLAVWTGGDPQSSSAIIDTSTSNTLDFQFDFEGDTQSYDYSLTVFDNSVSFY